MTRVWFNRTFSNVRAVLELIRQGDAAGEFWLICTHPEPSFPGFKAAHAWALEPADLKGLDYLEFCLDLCRHHRIDALWPGQEAPLLAEHAAQFAEIGVQVLAVAKPQTLALIQDKARFAELGSRLPIPTPDTIPFRTLAEFDAAYERLRCVHEALCIKPAQGVYGSGFRLIREGEHGLDGLLQGGSHSIQLDCLRRLLTQGTPTQTWLLMEYLPGPEYSLDAVADGERLVALIQREKREGIYGQQLVARPELTKATAELVVRFGLKGLFNIQFRAGRGGLRLLEINPRFSGGIGYAAAAGLNLPYLALRGWIQGFETPETPQIAPPARVLEVLRYERDEGEMPSPLGAALRGDTVCTAVSPERCTETSSRYP